MKYAATFLLGLAMAPLSMALSVGEPLPYWPAVRRNNDKSSDKDNNDDKNNDDKNNNDNNNNDGSKVVIDLSDLKDGKKSDGSSTQVIIIWVNQGNGAETTTINEKVTVTQTVTAGAEATSVAPAAASHTVTVGGPGGLTYQPDQLNDIPIGDTVIFEFLSQNHTVTQSAFDTPCDPLEAGMDSGFMANPNNTVSPPPQIAMQVMVDTPLWFYCRQTGHCGKGMVFSINPTADKTQAQFQALAIQQKGDGTDTPITNPSATPSEGDSAATATSTAAAEATATESVAPGKGTQGSDGSCTCVAICSSGSFPVAAQGIGAFGGSAGGLPINMAAL